jgi:glycosyltransferase
MTISIITATYNSAVTVNDTLECIQQQNYPFIEHIIVDGFSSDDTMKIVKRFSHV